MMGFARRLFGASNRSSDNDADADAASAEWQLTPTDRIGLPLARSRARIWRRGLGMLALAGVGFALYDEPQRATRWWSVASGMATPAWQSALRDFNQTASQQQAAATSPASLPEPPPRAIPDTPPPPTPEPPLPPSPEPEVATAAGMPPVAAKPVSPPARPASPQPSTPYAAPEKSVVTDPYEARATAAGLHPELSRALLARLSDTDFRNAGIATRTAVATTPDDGTYRWPRHQSADLATFEVRFVRGAAPHCRRYIVTVAKDHWLTTAQPVEKCGVSGPRNG